LCLADLVYDPGLKWIETVSLQSAMTKDTLDWARSDQADPITFLKDAYLHPAFKEKQRLTPGLAAFPGRNAESSGEDEGEARVIPLKGKYTRQSSRGSARGSMSEDVLIDGQFGRSSQDGSCRSPSELSRAESLRESKGGSLRMSKRSSAVAPMPEEEEVEVHEMSTN
jgi:hypothetical protein